MSEILFLTINLSGTNTAACGALSVKCEKAALCKLARKLVNEKHDIFTPVRVMRGSKQVFKTAPLWVFARLTTVETANTSVRFTKYRADPRFAEARP